MPKRALRHLKNLGKWAIPFTERPASRKPKETRSDTEANGKKTNLSCVVIFIISPCVLNTQKREKSRKKEIEQGPTHVDVETRSLNEYDDNTRQSVSNIPRAPVFYQKP